MTNKPFDPTKPYYRRDGKPAKIVYKFEGGHFLVVSKLRFGEDYYAVQSSGLYLGGNGTHDRDLINIPEKIEGWMVVYTRDMIYATNQTANKYKGVDAKACIKVSFTEGEGLE